MRVLVTTLHGGVKSGDLTESEGSGESIAFTVYEFGILANLCVRLWETPIYGSDALPMLFRCSSDFQVGWSLISSTEARLRTA